jgi:hypothetical protein
MGIQIEMTEDSTVIIEGCRITEINEQPIRVVGDISYDPKRLRIRGNVISSREDQGRPNEEK